MAEVKKLEGSKRFGARYGRRIKHKVDDIERVLKGKHQCPYCHSPAAKRLAAGIWQCRKCEAKFTGRAYDVAKKVRIKEEVAEPEEPEEEEQDPGEEEPEAEEMPEEEKQEEKGAEEGQQAEEKKPEEQETVKEASEQGQEEQDDKV